MTWGIAKGPRAQCVVDKMAMVSNEPCYISVSRDGYIKRFSERAFKANEDTIPSTKDGDALLGVKYCDTLDTLLLFTTKGNIAYVPVFKLEECKFKEVGKHVSTYVKMEGQEKIVGAIIVKNFDTFAFVVTATKNGMVKKTSIPRMVLERTSKAVSGMKLKANDELASMCVCYEEDDLIFISKQGYCARYSSEIIADLAPKAQGVMGMNVKNDELVAVLADHHDSDELLISTNKGGFKRIHKTDLELTNRNAKGYRIFKQIKSNPHEINHAVLTSGYNSLYVDCGEDLYELSVAEIPFMELDASFSTPLKTTDNYFYVKKDMSDIEEVKIVDIPDGYYEAESDDEQTSLFD